ncbi:hypothetical protein SKAU_G00137590 [Synaphobranchus kaupii]|uniref:Uncharacterized protein n=1 Tax=Synaphobranchus kaupii TaxID=118154 RepID=A0A9Q1FSP3_SYNKA|nr:hypothetical protein SKAU_G00137590 [Synaphobranchus kaupii]
MMHLVMGCSSQATAHRHEMGLSHPPGGAIPGADQEVHSPQREGGRSPVSQKKHFKRHQDINHTKHLSREELERKRQQMMDFAKQRDEQRVNNLQKYRRQEEHEKERDCNHNKHAGFIHDVKLEGACSTLEERVKRNIHSLQRTPAALEKNFMNR